jgi:putative transposase
MYGIRNRASPMPRRARLELPGIPMHITQRGVNRGAVFVDDEDRRHYLDLLQAETARMAVAVHAYVLMGNHVHLLASAKAARAISRALQRLGQAYVQAFNRRHRRTGTLWEGRFKSCLVASDHYLLSVYRYIDLNPVRAAMVASPEAYRWSSARGNLGLAWDPVVTPHPTFLALGSDPATRGMAYRAWVQESLASEDVEAIRAHLQQERALGDQRFQTMVEIALGRPVRVRRPGRPAAVIPAKVG